MLSRRVAVVLATAVAALCALAAGAAAKTKVVYAGGPASFQKSLQSTGGSVDSFLIDKVTINACDTVVWNGASLSGGFHTVDIPKLGGEDLPLVTATGKTVHGVLDAAGNPFWFNDKVPELGFNTKLFGPSGGNVYNGTTRIDSGLPLSPKPHNFAVKFTTPGTYKFFCDVHPGMFGFVVVKAKGKAVPTAAQDAATLKAEERRDTAEATAVLRSKVPHNSVSLGLSAANGVEILGMFPAVLHVKKGTTVKFFMPKGSREQHTATFGPKSYLGPLSKSFQGPAPAPQAVYPSDPRIVLTPASHGNGFANVGVLDQDPSTPLKPSSAITFAKPGKYHFVCLIHPFMHGTIVVK